MVSFKKVWTAAAALMLTFSLLQGAELVTNGGFESGDFTGWNIYQSGSGNFYIYSGTTTPVSGYTVPAPFDGSYAALTDQNNPGTHILYQDVVVPTGGTALFSAVIFVENRAGDYAVGPDLDYNSGSNQQVRVDIVDPAASLLTTTAGPGGVLENVFQTNPGDPLSIPYTTITANLSAYHGQTVRLRFAAVETQYYLHFGVDNVSVTTAVSVPVSDGAKALLALLFAASAFFFFRRETRTVLS